MRPAKLPSETRQWSVAACKICWLYKSLQALQATHVKLKSMEIKPIVRLTLKGKGLLESFLHLAVEGVYQQLGCQLLLKEESLVCLNAFE